MVAWLSPEKLNRLASDPSRCTPDVSEISVDSRRPFVPEHHTQLYFTPVYQDLHFEHRLRYNQLFGCRINEYIMMLEADLVDRLLIPLKALPQVAGDEALVAAIDTMIDEEKRHYRNFVALNRTCRPDIYPPGTERVFSKLPVLTKSMFWVAGLLASRLAFSLWYLMALEESSMAFARDAGRNSQTETLGELDEGFVLIHTDHMKDEMRHVQLDGILVDLCINRQPAWRRRVNAWLFQNMLPGALIPRRSGSGVMVVRQLVRDMPELQDREEEMIQAVLDLGRNAEYQKSLFNRTIMPMTFAVFDETPEFDTLGNFLQGYDRR